MAWAPDYITAAELRAWARSAYADTDDDELDQAIDAASRDVDEHCGRQFGSAAGTREYVAWRNFRTGVWTFDVDDVMVAPTAVVIDGTTLTSSDYELLPRNAAADGRPWTQLTIATTYGACPPTATITATWGWTAVPDGVKLATKIQAARFAGRRDQLNQPDGVQAGSVYADPSFFIALKSFRRVKAVG